MMPEYEPGRKRALSTACCRLRYAPGASHAPLRCDGSRQPATGNLLRSGVFGLSLPVVFFLSCFTCSLAALDRGDRGYVDLREMASRMNMDVSWEAERGRMVIQSEWSRIELEGDTRSLRFNGVRVFLGEAVVERGGGLHMERVDYESFLVPLLAPRNGSPPPRRVRTVAIDPGHGGSDRGARIPGAGLFEKDLVLDLSFRLERLLREHGYRVVLTRRDDSFVPLDRRAEIANQAGADMFLSIHFNAAGSSSVRGTETYVLTPRTHRSTGQQNRQEGDNVLYPGNRYDHWNSLLGFYMQRRLLNDLRTFDRGFKRARFQVLREVSAPAVLIEAGYLSNAEEARRIATSAYRQRIAETIFEGVRHYDATMQRLGAR